MKRFTKIFTLILSLFCCQFLMAQDPVLDCASAGNGDGTICAQDLANFSIALSANAVLPNTEYVVVDPNNILDPDGMVGTGDEGPAVLGASTTGMFDPATFAAFAPGDQVCVIAVSFNVGQLQSLIDAIYGASGIGIPCCTLVETQFAGLCADLMGAGINSGADVTSLQDIITIASAFTGGSTSLEAVVGVISTLNANLGTLGTLGCTGGVTTIDYAIDGVTEADGTGTPTSCCTTVLDNADMACATATCAAITGVTASATEACDGDMVTICVDFDAAADDVTVNGAGPAAAGDTQICYDVAAANMGCQPLDQMDTPNVVCTLDMMPVAGATAAMWTTYPNAGFTVTTNDDGSTCGTPQIEVFSADATSCGTVDGAACGADGDMETLDGATLLTAAPAALACQLPDLTAAVTCAGCTAPAGACDAPTVVACGDIVTGDTSTDGVIDPALAGQDCGLPLTSETVVFEFMGTGDEVTVDLGGSGFDTQINVYEGTCGDATACVGSDDDSSPAGGFTSLFTFISTPGTTYYFAIDGFGAANGAFSMEVTCVPPPANPCDTPIAIACGDVLTGVSTDGSDFAGNANCGQTLSGSPAIAFEFVGTGDDVTFDLSASLFDTQINVYQGTCGDAAACVGSDDDGGTGTTSLLLVPATVLGDTYYVIMDGFGAASGDYSIEAVCPVPACSAMAGEPVIPGDPNNPIEICQADAGTVSVMNEFNASTGMDDNMNAVVTNYLGINNATNEIVSVANTTAMLDLSMAAPGDVICVQSVAYTQATLDNLTGAIDGVSGAIGIPPIGMVDLSGFLNFLTGFITVDAATLEDIFTNGLDLNTLTGIGFPDIPAVGAGIVCADFSADFYCVTILPGTDPACFTGMACDPAVCNDITFTIVSFDWTGLGGQFTAGLEGVDADIELAYSFDGGSVFNVMGGASGSDLNSAGTTFSGSTTAPGNTVAIEVCFWENDCGSDLDYDNDTDLFGPCVANADDPFGDSNNEGAATTCETINFDITATSVTGTNYTVNYTASCTEVTCAGMPMAGVNITDPCSCGGAMNVDTDTDGTFDLFYEEITISTNPVDATIADWAATFTSGDPKDMTGASVAPTIVNNGDGTYTVGFYLNSGETYSVGIASAATGLMGSVSGGGCMPCPDIPTLSEWGLMTLALLLMTLGAVKMAVGSVALVGVGSKNVPMPFNASFRLPFDMAVLRKALNITAILAFIGFAICFAIYGAIFLPDVIGVAIAGPIFAYLAHLLYILETRNK